MYKIQEFPRYQVKPEILFEDDILDVAVLELAIPADEYRNGGAMLKTGRYLRKGMQLYEARCDVVKLHVFY